MGEGKRGKGKGKGGKGGRSERGENQRVSKWGGVCDGVRGVRE